jgi:PAS domain
LAAHDGVRRPSSLDIDVPELAALLRLWEARRPSLGLPRRADFTPEVLQPWLGNVGILDVERHPLRFRIRLAGTVLTGLYGQDYTGRYLEEVVPDLRPHVRCAETGEPQYDAVSSQPKERVRYALRRLLLPVSLSGDDVGQIIAGIYPGPAGASVGAAL